MVQSLPQSDGFRILFNSPELSEVQRSGFHCFLKKGIAEELSKISCIQVKNAHFLVEIIIDAQNFQLVTPETNYRDCILKLKSYTCKLYVQAKIFFKDKISGELLYQTQPEWVLLADLPIMTKRGHFVINGSPRVVVHQVGRAPGIYFKKILKQSKDINNKARFYCDIIPRKGVWVRLQISKKGEIDLKLKKSKKIRAEMVQSCLQLLEKEESFLDLQKSLPAGMSQWETNLPQNAHMNAYKTFCNRASTQNCSSEDFFLQNVSTPSSDLCLPSRVQSFFSPQTSLLVGLNSQNCFYSKTWQIQAFVTNSGSSLYKKKNSNTIGNFICCHAIPYWNSVALPFRTVTQNSPCLLPGWISSGRASAVLQGVARPSLGAQALLSYKVPAYLQGAGELFTKAEKEAFANLYSSFYKNGIEDIADKLSMSLLRTNPIGGYKERTSGKEVLTTKVKNSRTLKKTKVSKKKRLVKKQNLSANLNKIREYLYQLFKRSDFYDLGPVGREKINTKFGISIIETQLTALDIKEAINWLSKVRAGKEEIDDIDHSQNRRVRTSSELIQTQFEIGITRLKNFITKKLRNNTYKGEHVFMSAPSKGHNPLLSPTVKEKKLVYRTNGFLQTPSYRRSRKSIQSQAFFGFVNRPERSSGKERLHVRLGAFKAGLHNPLQGGGNLQDSARIGYMPFNVVSKSNPNRLAEHSWLDKLHLRGESAIFVKDNKIVNKVKSNKEVLTTKAGLQDRLLGVNKAQLQCKNKVFAKERTSDKRLPASSFVADVGCLLWQNKITFTSINPYFMLVAMQKQSFCKGNAKTKFLQRQCKNEVFAKEDSSDNTSMHARLGFDNEVTVRSARTPGKVRANPNTLLQGVLAPGYRRFLGLNGFLASKDGQFSLGPLGPIRRAHKDVSHLQNNQLCNSALSELFSTKPINGALREFFSSSPLSQYMDQSNPLAEITHKRRISSLGIGGVSRESAGMTIRGIHPTHYGRICPIETPEGKNAGLVNSLAFYAKINNQGFIETPYYQVLKGQIQHELGFSFYSAEQESQNGLHIAPNDITQSKSKLLGTSTSTVESIPVRVADNLLDLFKKVTPYKVDCIGISPVQILSVATSLIPFLEHNDANRALMGSNMQRQAVPLMISERPLVGTGLEARVLAESGHPVQSKVSGFVSNISAHKIVVEDVLYRRTVQFSERAHAKRFLQADCSKTFCYQSRYDSIQRRTNPIDVNKVQASNNLKKHSVILKNQSSLDLVPTIRVRTKQLVHLADVKADKLVQGAQPPLRESCSYGVVSARKYNYVVQKRFCNAFKSCNIFKKDTIGKRVKIVCVASPSYLHTNTNKDFTSIFGVLPYLQSSFTLQDKKRVLLETEGFGDATLNYSKIHTILSTTLSRRSQEQEDSKKILLRGAKKRSLVDASKVSANRIESVSKKKFTLLPVTHSITTFSRSNQETCLIQKPLVEEGDWVQKGDMLSECSAGHKGELSVGKNMLLAYIPWQGYNFEDAIVISDRLVKEQLYTSLHIERYTVLVNDFKDKIVDTNEWFTGNLPGIALKKITHLQKSGLPIIGTILKEGDILVGKIKYSKKKPATPHEKLVCDILGEQNFSIQNSSLYVPKGVHEARVLTYKIKKRFDKSLKNNLRPAGAPKIVHIFLGEKRNIQVGDKMSGRHGNKGIVSTILPLQDMPYLADGTPIDILLNPLGVPSRMNVGQIFECLLGLASTYLHQNFKITAFDELYGSNASQSVVFLKVYQARLQSGQNWLFQVNFPGKTRLVDGKSGECFDQWVTVGRAYILKLIHMVNEKIHARAIGPYALVTQQPLKGRAHKGGQRLGEMEVWAVEGFGAAYILQELLTKKSDDSIGRKEVLKAMLPKHSSSVSFAKLRFTPLAKTSFSKSPSKENKNQVFVSGCSVHPDKFCKYKAELSSPSSRTELVDNFSKGSVFENSASNILGQPDIFKVLICELQALCLDVGVYSMKTKSFQRKFLAVFE